MALGGNNTVGILIKTEADTNGIDKTSSSIGRLEQSAGGGSKAAAALGTAGRIAAVGVAAAGAAIGAAGVAAIGAAGSYEQSRIAFETMLGSADKARSLMGQIATFAKETPFELPEVVAGSKQLLAFGFAQEQIIPTMRKLGDIASGVGVPVGQLTNVFGQVRVAGRLMGQDLMQFTNAGVPLIEALATTMGKPQSEIKKLVEQGKVGFPEVEVAINSLTNKGSKFGGMMEKQSHSFNGVVSNIKDGFGQILRGAVGMTVTGDIIKGGLFDKVSRAAQAAMPLVQKAGEMAGPAVMKAMEMAGKAVNTVVKAMKDLWAIVGPYIMPSLMALVTTLQTQFLPALQRLWAIIEPYLIPTLKVLGIILGAILVAQIWVAINIINVLYKVIGFLINIAIEVGQRIAWMVNFIVQYLTLLYNFWKTIFTAIYSVAKVIFQAIYLAIAVVVSLIMAVVKPVANYLYQPFLTAKNWIVGAWQGLLGWFRGIAGAVGGALSGVQNAIQAPFQHAWDWISGLPGRIAGAIGNVGQLLRDKIGDWDIPGPLGKVRDVIPGFATGGFTGTGGMHQVAGVVHRGEYVIPKSQVDQSTGLPKMSNRTVSINTVILGTADAAREFFDQLDSDTMLTGRGMTPVRGGA